MAGYKIKETHSLIKAIGFVIVTQMIKRVTLS